MKTCLTSVVIISLSTLLTVCCQSQPTGPHTNSTDSTGQQTEILRNLVQDTVAISTLTDDDRDVLQRRYANNRAVVSYRVIKDPFPRADSLAAIRKLRCNMSATRVFFAERKSFDFSGSKIVWEGKLTGTGFNIDRPDYNYISLWLSPDNSVQGGYRFSRSFVQVSNTESYEFEPFPPYDYFVLVQYNPNAGMVIMDSNPTPSPTQR